MPVPNYLFAIARNIPSMFLVQLLCLLVYQAPLPIVVPRALNKFLNETPLSLQARNIACCVQFMDSDDKDAQPMAVSRVVVEFYVRAPFSMG